MTLRCGAIRFPFRALTPVRRPPVDANATAAVKHAVALTAVVTAVFHSSDLLYGVCEVYHALWNAVLTLAWLHPVLPAMPLLAHRARAFPGRDRCVRYREGEGCECGEVGGRGAGFVVRLAEESQRAKEEVARGGAAGVGSEAVMVEKEGGAASRGASATGEPSSSSAVSALAADMATPQILSSAFEEVQIPSLVTLEQQQQHQQMMAAPVEASDITQDGGLLPTAEQDDLWSWMNVVALPRWPDYQHGVDELFTDIIDLDILIDKGS